jgi:hypothetical protein
MAVDVAALIADAGNFQANEWVPHFNTRCFAGDWSGVALRSPGGDSRRLYPDATGRLDFADTPALDRCPGVRALLTDLTAPLQFVRFLRLGPSSSIFAHRDHELGYAYGEVRLHVPLTTNPGVRFTLGGIPIDMQPGEVWYLDLEQEHMVDNTGASPRDHLVIDCRVDDQLDALLNAGMSATA